MSDTDIVKAALNALCPRSCENCDNFLSNKYVLPQQREKDGMCSLSFDYKEKRDNCSKWEQCEKHV